MKDLKRGELQNILDSKEPVVIFFYMQSCPHCQVMHEPWDELEKEEPNTKFVKVESAEIPQELGISGFPHFENREDKKVKKVVKGEMSKNYLPEAGSAEPDGVVPVGLLVEDERFASEP